MQAESQPEYPRLYSLSGFRYCDLLLSDAERAAWKLEFNLQVRELDDGVPLVVVDDHLGVGAHAFQCPVVHGPHADRAATIVPISHIGHEMIPKKPTNTGTQLLFCLACKTDPVLL